MSLPLRPEEMNPRLAKNRLRAAVRQCDLQKLECDLQVARDQLFPGQTFKAIVRSSLQRGEQLYSAEIQMASGRKVFAVDPQENLHGVLLDVLDWSQRQGKAINWDYRLERKV